MTRQELVQDLEKLRVCNKSDLWKVAFKMYRDASGRYLTLGCSSCCTEVLKWLKK